MPQMNNAQVRLVDPILTSIAQGYRQQDLVGMNLFPAVPVQVSGGQVLEFGKEAFKAYSTARAPGGSTKRIQFGHLGRPFALENHSLEGLLPREHVRDAQVSPGVDLASRAINQTMAAMLLALEVQQAGIALTAASYDANHKVALTGTSKWSDDTSDPIKQFDTYKEAIRTSTGRYPNVMLVSASGWNAFRNNAKVIDRIKYVNQGVLTEQIAAAMLGLDRIVVGRAVKSDDAGTFSDIWGNNAVIAYTALGSKGMEEPSYGYTYTMEGNPAAEEGYYERNSKSWIYPVSYERAPVLSGITAGFLVQNPA